MIYRDFDKKIIPPHHDGKWIYSDPIYQKVEDCFLRTQRPIGVKEYKDNKPRLLDPFRKINKHKMQKYFDDDNYKNLDWVTDESGEVRAAIIYYDIYKMSNKKKSNEMWGGRFSEKSTDLLTKINSSIDIDKRLAFEDILGSQAHVEMLAKMNIISKQTKKKI